MEGAYKGKWGTQQRNRVRAARLAKGRQTGQGPANATSHYRVLWVSRGPRDGQDQAGPPSCPHPRPSVLVHWTFQALRCLRTFTHAVQDRPLSPLAARRPGFNPRVGKIPWRRERQPMPVFLPGKCQGRRSLVDWPHHSSLLAPSLSTQQSD